MRKYFMGDRWNRYYKYILKPYIIPLLTGFGVYRDEEYGKLINADDELFIVENEEKGLESYIGVPTCDYEYNFLKKEKTIILEPIGIEKYGGKGFDPMTVLFNLIYSIFSDNDHMMDHKYIIVRKQSQYESVIIYKLEKSLSEKLDNGEDLVGEELNNSLYREYSHIRRPDIPMLFALFELLKIYNEDFYNSTILPLGTYESIQIDIENKIFKVLSTKLKEYDSETYQYGLSMNKIIDEDENLNIPGATSSFKRKNERGSSILFNNLHSIDEEEMFKYEQIYKMSNNETNQVVHEQGLL